MRGVRVGEVAPGLFPDSKCQAVAHRWTAKLLIPGPLTQTIRQDQQICSSCGVTMTTAHTSICVALTPAPLIVGGLQCC